MATIPISRPSIPFVGLIPGGLTIGRGIRIKGHMTHGADRFAIYVQRSPSLYPRDDCSVHLSVRPNENTIVRNHYTNQQWGHEERHGGCPIQRGGYFNILISAEPTFFKITINGVQFCTFNYRLPVFGNSQYIAIEGDCTISFIGHDTDAPHMGPTPYVQVAPPISGVPPSYIPPHYPPTHHPPVHHPPVHHPPMHHPPVHHPPMHQPPSHHIPGLPHDPHHHHHHHHHHPPGPPGPPGAPWPTPCTYTKRE